MRKFQVNYHRQQHRTGMVLVLVLVVVMVLSFAVYSFCSVMVAEYSATSTGLHHLQRRELINSGIEYAGVLRQQQRGNSNVRGLLTWNRTVEFSLPNNQRAAISMLRSLPAPGAKPSLGLNDESAKLNLNSLPLELSKRKESRQRMMEIPGITLQMSDAILDWIDEDDEPSEFGAETSFYTAQNPPRKPRQGPFAELSELLKVRGFTPQIVFGEDQNQNGLLDASENDGSASYPPDNADGVLQRGLSEFITVSSCESLVIRPGRRKINLNQPKLAALYDEIEPVLGKDAATYIVAWRMRGATYIDEPRPDEGADQEQRRLERMESARKRLEAQLGVAAGAPSSESSSQSSRGGLTLTDGAMTFRSIVDLFGGQIQIMINGQDTLLKSPWPSDPATVQRMLPALEMALTTSSGPTHVGRINVNEASETVLRTIPGISHSAARAIARIQPEIQRSTQKDEFRSVAWLLTRGVLTMPDLRIAGAWLTTQGDVFSGFAVAQTHGQQAVSITEFTLDCSGPTRRITMLHDLEPQSARLLGLPDLAMQSAIRNR